MAQRECVTRQPPSEDVSKLRWLDRYLRGKDLIAIDRNVIDHVTKEKLARGWTNATVNRTLELLRAVLRKCVNEWEWLDRAPYVRMLKEPTRRIRFLTREEAQKLLAELPAHLADMATFSLATGLRAANVTGLEWSQVDEERKLAWVHPDQAKARKAIAVPLNAEALSLVLKQKGMHATHVFSYRGKPITQVSTKAWYGALKRAGIEKFRWHDLRHTWASWHVQGGTPLFALAGTGGLGVGRDGASLCASRGGSLGALCRSFPCLLNVPGSENSRHVYGTERKSGSLGVC